MTMPHLMNCGHGDAGEHGWCLDCVKKLHDEKEKADSLFADHAEKSRLRLSACIESREEMRQKNEALGEGQEILWSQLAERDEWVKRAQVERDAALAKLAKCREALGESCAIFDTLDTVMWNSSGCPVYYHDAYAIARETLEQTK